MSFSLTGAPPIGGGKKGGLRSYGTEEDKVRTGPSAHAHCRNYLNVPAPAAAFQVPPFHFR